MLREVAWALAYAHAQGVVHRDVKPDNILIEASTGRALVTDFGIAAVIGDGDADGVSGTPEYMSPEQALGVTIDSRSDLYGLGATAFYAFAGRPPFEGRTAEEILARQVTEPPPPLASLGLAVPRKLASLVDQCLAKDSASRPASAEALAEQLGRTIDQQRTLPAALRAFVRRNGRMDGGGTLLYATALLATSIGTSTLIGMRAGFATFTVGLAAAPIGFAVLAARRLLRLGFAHADLGPAFRAELESGREERAVERGRQSLPRVDGVVGGSRLRVVQPHRHAGDRGRALDSRRCHWRGVGDPGHGGYRHRRDCLGPGQPGHPPIAPRRRHGVLVPDYGWAAWGRSRSAWRASSAARSRWVRR